jgi:hypothetical protein
MEEMESRGKEKEDGIDSTHRSHVEFKVQSSISSPQFIVINHK